MKNLKLFVFTLVSFMVMGVVSVNAAEVLDYTNLKACLESTTEITCTLASNVDAEDSMIVKSNVTLDLNGYTISMDNDTYENAIIVVYHGGKLTIKDSSTAKTGKISYITDLTTTSVRTAIKMTQKGGDNTKVAELVIDGGTIEGDSYAISGNGSSGRDNTKITINDGKLYSKATAVFQPQEGEIIVNGGTIEGKTGIEIRSGKLTVNGGTITGNGIPLTTNQNGNGTTTIGAGIAVAQHTTTHDIVVEVNGGTVKGYTAFVQASPEANSDSTKVSIELNDGTFEAINGGTKAVESEDKTEFIEGGTYSSDIKDYVSKTSNLVSKEVNGEYVVGVENKVTVNTATNGTVTANLATAVVGEKISLTLTPAAGYEIDTITVVDANNKAVTVTDNSFVMPDSDVTVTVAYKETVVTPTTPTTPEVPKTGDSIALYITLGAISIGAIALTLNNLKKRATR